MEQVEEIKKLDVEKIRQDFPILLRKVNGKTLVYFDNAATSQKPKRVIDFHVDYYINYNANIHRGIYQLSTESSEAYENSREKVQKFINANESSEIIFTSGTTGAINLVAHSFGRYHIKTGDEIMISTMEHHANIVPWQMLCAEKNANLRIIPINENGEILMDEFEKMLNERTKLVSLAHISNTLGTINPVKRVIEIAHSRNIPVLLDGAQAVVHKRVDMKELDCDFYTFSGHKMFGPTGIGVLYGKREILDSMPPYQTGGDMIKSVSFERTTFNELPYKFEAGTPNIAGAIGLGISIDYLNSLDYKLIEKHEQELLRYMTSELIKIDGIKIIGTALEKVVIVSFVVDGLHALDIGIMLDTMGIEVRTGQHCTEPLMDRFGVPGTIRASLAFYNTMEEVEYFIGRLKDVIDRLRGKWKKA